MFRKKPPQDSTVKDDEVPHVTLKPKAGVPPHIYVPLCYLAIPLIIFGVIIYTRVFVHKGEYLHIKSVPNNSAVYVDDHYLGTTPIKKFLAPGEHRVQISMPFYTPYDTTFTSKNTIFLRKNLRASVMEASLLPLFVDEARVPDLTQLENSSLVAHTVAQLASWNTSNTHTARVQRNPVLKNTIDSLNQVKQSIQNNPKSKDDYMQQSSVYDIFYKILYSSLPYIATAKQGSEPTAEFQLVVDTYNALTQEERFTALLQSNTEVYAQFPIVKNNQFYQQENSTSTNVWEIPSKKRFPSLNKNAQENIVMLQLPFSKISSRTLYYHTQEVSNAAPTDPIQSYMEIADNNEEPNSPHTISLQVEVPSFYILNREITQGDFAQFLKATNTHIAAWKAQHKTLVSPDYQEHHFKDYNPTLHPSRPLRYITWYDAYYFTQWLDNNMRTQGYYAQLPTEYHWRAAVLEYPQLGVYNQDFGYIPQPASNAPMLLGSLWEWGKSWYSPSPQYAGLHGPTYGSERHIFGGSYITKKEDTLENTPVYLTRNASQLPSWATPYVGFRIMLSPLEYAHEQ